MTHTQIEYFLNNTQVRTIRNFVSFSAYNSQCLINYTENLSVTYLLPGRYRINFINGKTPPNIYYSVSISGTWNNRADDNSGMIYSVDFKTMSSFIMTQKLVKDNGNPARLSDGDVNYTPDLIQSNPFTEVSVSY